MEHFKTILASHSVRYRERAGRLKAEDVYSIERAGRVRFGRGWAE